MGLKVTKITSTQISPEPRPPYDSDFPTLPKFLKIINKRTLREWEVYREPQKERGEHEAGGKFKRCSDTSMNLIENSMTTTISYSNMLTVILGIK